jgi:uncharacterized membrane protein YphA (DoxX/SURF4 family)
VLTAVCRYLLAAVFLMAAVTKITAPDEFKERVLHDAHLPADVAMAVVRVLPWLELTGGACLALGYAVRETALLTALLLVLFTVHGVVNHAEPDCGCLLVPLPEPAAAPWWPPLRNALLLLCTLPLLRRDLSLSARRPSAQR